jgi:hypothetical protein
MGESLGGQRELPDPKLDLKSRIETLRKELLSARREFCGDLTSDVFQAESYTSSKEYKEHLLEEIEDIFQSTHAMLERRDELMFKEALTAAEKEEFEGLNKVAVDVDEVRKIVKSAFNGHYPYKLKRLNDMKLMYDLKDDFDITDVDILSARFCDPEVLRKMNPSRATIDAINLGPAGLDSRANIFQYCDLPKETKTYLEEVIVNDVAIEKGDLLVSYLVKYKFSKKSQDKLIRKLQKYADEIHETQDYWGVSKEQMLGAILSIDVLGSEVINNAQKRKLADCYVKMGTGLDCQLIMIQYERYLTPQSRKIAEAKTKSRGNPDYRTPSLYEIDKEQLKGKKLHFVTHPFWELGTPRKLMESEKDPEKLFTKTITLLLEKAKETLKTKPVCSDYLKAYKLYAEYKRFKELQKQEDTITVLLSPKAHSPIGYEGASSPDLIQQMYGNSGNLFRLESDSNISGSLKSQDSNFLKDLIEDDTQLEVSGAYIGKCMQGTASSLIEMGKGERVLVDYSMSYPQFDELGVYRQDKWKGWDLHKLKDFSEKELAEHNMPRVHIPEGLKIENPEDLEQIFEANREFNEALEEFIFQQLAVEETKDYRYNAWQATHVR